MGLWKNIKCAFGFHSWREKTEILDIKPSYVIDGVGHGARITYGDTRRVCWNCGRRELMTSSEIVPGQIEYKRSWRVERSL
jgi:hypothetical protein